MIQSIITHAIQHRAMVLLLILGLCLLGIYSIKQTPIDALPDLSDVQVIVKASYPGQSPQIVEDQVTRPLATALMSVPKAKTIRGFSLFGDSYLYVLFDDDTDIYWARSRVLEYLNQAKEQLPESVTPTLGPDATGVGWVYIYALQDTTGQSDTVALRELQDWFLRFELQSLPQVAEVATMGGMEKEIAIRLDPHKLRAYELSIMDVKAAIKASNQSVGAHVIELSEAEYRVFSEAYLNTPHDFHSIAIKQLPNGNPLLLSEVADIHYEPAIRRQVADLNGLGEATGGVIVMRFGENAKQTIERVKQKLAELKKQLPKGIEIIEVYDRSALINRSINTLWQTLALEWVIIGLVCLLFLGSFSGALVAIISLPVGILIAFIFMRFHDINANILSLGGIAIAIGTMVDGAIVMLEQTVRSLQKNQGKKPHWQIIKEASIKTGPAVFFSLLIIVVSFLPVFL
ncbi:MAG: efflux RND transporter permease subunit, partial [Cellvibrionales bacterium]|nr:efflux RND transporter permease subunit [Cellvibrionales bacterium]